MSNFTEARDLDELEGTLLPAAHAVVPDNAVTSRPTLPLVVHDDDDDMVAIPVTAATPVSYFAYPNNDNDNEVNNINHDEDGTNTTNTRTTHIQQAAAVPLVTTTQSPDASRSNIEANDAVLRQQLAHGERAGRMDNESQVEDINKANRKVHAINYFTQKQVAHGTRRASHLSRHENQQGWAGPTTELSAAMSAAVAAKTGISTTTTAPSSKPVPPHGKEYEVAEYDVKEYDTRDYEVSEYKSIYES